MRHIDIRLVIGCVLVGASIAGVYGIVATADHTTAVYVVNRPLAAGHVLHSRDLAVVHVRLAGASALYVDEGGLRSGTVLLRPLENGEFLPLSALGSARDITSTTLVVALTSQLPVETHPGAIMDLWTAPQLGQNNFGPPTVLVAQAQIARVVESNGIGSAAQGVEVEVIIPRTKVAQVLQAQANGDVLSLVPAAGGGDKLLRPVPETTSTPDVPAGLGSGS
jgi:hypothetical protein